MRKEKHPLRPLAGVTVVSLEHVIAGPFCTRQLADLDARIIKIECPGVPESFDARMDPIPSIGQHTDAILGELGYDQAAIAGLRSQGII